MSSHSGSASGARPSDKPQRHLRLVPKLRLCKQCGDEPALPHKQVGYECWLRKQPITVRLTDRQRRLDLVPPELRRARVPASEWPPGRRWCAGCQSFVLLVDCPKSGSRCKTCSNVAGHASRLKGEYGIDAATYEALLELQGGRCAICGRRPKTKRLAVDHDHATGEVRGLLCPGDDGCNHRLLGYVRDRVDLLQRAIDYLNEPPAQRLGDT